MHVSGVTQHIAQFACDYDLSTAPDELLHRATRAFIDTIGVAIAGNHEECFTILARTFESPAGPSTVLPTGERTTAAHAALLNATAGHALDFDDVADEIVGHPSVVLVPPLLALAEATGSTGRELLEAYVVGFDVSCAVARGLPVDAHYRFGWHATGTIGVLGATAACSRLLRLDEMRVRNALGIAASMASGSQQNFGTMTKPLHAGLAARDAVTAVQLAANGFTADPDQLEGPRGYFALYGVQPDTRLVIEALGEPTVLQRRGLNVKKYPCCYLTHRPADAALALFERGLRGPRIESVSLTVAPGGLQAVIHHRPTTGLQGKFSAEYVLAACFLDGRVGLTTFTDSAVNRAEAQDLLRRVSVDESASPPFGPAEFDHAYAAVEVVLTDGTVERERCDIPRGDARHPLSDADLEAKFHDCLSFGDTAWHADSLLSSLWRLSDAVRHELLEGRTDAPRSAALA